MESAFEMVGFGHLSDPDLDSKFVKKTTDNNITYDNLQAVESSGTDTLTPPLSSSIYLARESTANITVELDQLQSASNPHSIQPDEIDADGLLTDNLKESDNELDLLPAVLQARPLETTDIFQPDDMDAEKPSAVCNYRWTKSIPVNSDDIGFYPSYSPDTPVLLSWNDKASAYFSTEIRIPAGDYHGNLIVSGRLYPTEEFSVRSYTFEVDLFMKDADEIIPTDPKQETSMHEKEKDTSPIHTSDSMELYSKSVYEVENVNSKAATPVDHHKADDGLLINDVQNYFLDNQLSSSMKSDDISLSTMKRDSPVGNDDAGTFSEYNFNRKYNDELLEEHHSSHEPSILNEASIKSSSKVSDQPGVGVDFVEDVVRPSSTLYSDVNSNTGPRCDTETGQRNSRPPSLGADSAHGFRQNSLKHSNSMDSIYGRPESKTSERFSPDNLRKADTNISRHQYTSEKDPDRSRTTEIPVNFTQTTMSKDRNSPALVSTQESPQTTPRREMIGENIYEHRRKRADSGEPIRSGSPASGRPPSHPGSRYGSQYPSRAQSLNSVVSDQELAQLFEHSRPSSAGSLQPRSAAVDAHFARGAERSTGASNLANQSQVPSNSREFLPPRSPVSSEKEKLRDIHGRSSDTSRLSSHASSRTVTPVPFESGNKEVSNDRIQDLEASVRNLRKLLAGHEAEVHSLTSQLEDLKDINQSLKEDLDHRGRRYTPVSNVQDSFEYKQLQSEKEILASEVVSLRDELQRLKKGQPGSRHNVTGSGIVDYSPNSPAVLQRKIVDLEAHIQDLHEVTEATNSSLMRAEEKLKLVQEENKDLKSRSYNKSDQQVELRTLKEDIKKLKERNQQLTEENLWLKEGQKEAARISSQEEPKYKYASLEPKHHFSSGDQRSTYSNGEHRHSSLKSDDASVRLTSGYTGSAAYRYGTSSLAHGVSDRNHGVSDRNHGIPDRNQGVSDRSHVVTSSPVSPSKVSHEDQLPRETRHVNQIYDLDQSQESQLHQYKNRSDPSRHRYQPRSDSSARAKLTESSRVGFQYPDRSKPDGEVSEKLYSDKYMRSPHEKQSFGDSRERRSYLDKHSSYESHFPRESTEIWSQDKFNVESKEDKYGYINDGLQDRDARAKSLDRFSSRGAISSRDIYLNLQQKRANKWLQQEERKQKLPSLNCDSDSDSTLVLMAGFTNELTEEDGVLNQPSAKIKGNEKGDLAHDGLTQTSLFTHDNKYISGNLGLRQHQPTRTYMDNPGDDSDTATDILLTQNIASKGLVHRRKTSFGSEGSPSSLSDLEDTTDSLLKRRSKSMDAKRGQTRQVSARHQSESASRTATSNERMSVGFRSVVPTPLVTQHNKGEIMSKHVTSLLNSSLTQGLRPFAPRSPADIRVDDVVKFSSLGGKLTQGRVKYVGHLPGRSETYLGVELDKDEGKHDGTFEGVRYFKCKPNKGVFVSFNKVVMAWAP